jgi:hypothetical protein
MKFTSLHILTFIKLTKHIKLSTLNFPTSLWELKQKWLSTFSSHLSFQVPQQQATIWTFFLQLKMCFNWFYFIYFFFWLGFWLGGRIAQIEKGTWVIKKKALFLIFLLREKDDKLRKGSCLTFHSKFRGA